MMKWRIFLSVVVIMSLWGCGKERAGGVTNIGNSIAGIVVDSLGKPAANARVQIFADTLWETQTDSLGRYDFANIPDGNWMLRVDIKQGARMHLLNLDTSHQEYFDTLHLTPYFQLRIRLLDAQLAIVGAQWRLDAASGVFVVDSIPQGDLRVCGNEVCRNFHVSSLPAGSSRRIPDLQWHKDTLQVVLYPLDSLPADYIGEVFIYVDEVPAEPWKVACRIALFWSDSLAQNMRRSIALLVNPSRIIAVRVIMECDSLWIHYIRNGLAMLGCLIRFAGSGIWMYFVVDLGCMPLMQNPIRPHYFPIFSFKESGAIWRWCKNLALFACF